MPVAVAEDALSCVALGTGKAAKNLNYVRRTAGVPAHKK
jgi:actin-like ATPase involved in cell morphogenesis